MSKSWSQLERHLKEYNLTYERKSLGGTNAHSVEAWVEAREMSQKITSNLDTDRFSEDDLKRFFSALHIGYPEWLT